MAAGHIAGFYHAQIAFRDSNGYPMGTQTDPDTVSNGTTTHAYKLTGPVETGTLSTTRESAAFRGGQKLLGRKDLGLSDVGSFDITLSAFDEQFHAYITRTAIDTSVATSNSLTTAGVNEADPPQMFLILTLGFQTTAGVNKYISYIYNNVQIAQANANNATQGGGENPNPLVYTVTPSVSDRTIFGLPYSSTTLSVVDNTDYYTRYVTTKPIAVTTYVALGSATEFTLGYRPYYSEHAGARNVWTKNGVDADGDVSGLSTTTGVATISSATAGHIYVATYETEFTAI